MFDTQILGSDEKSLDYAAELLRQGEVIGMPTETVYGLAANAYNENAVHKIFAAKGRPADNPLIVHIADFQMIYQLTESIPEYAIKCAEKFWPGPITMIMPKSSKIPFVTSGGLDTVGIRMPSHKAALSLIKKCGFPIAAPSANLSGSPSPTSAKHVLDDMNGKIPAVVDGGFSNVGVESTVISFENNGVRLLRPGFISVENLKEITENVFIDKGVLEKLGNDSSVRSPGMKYKHYAPKADIIIIDGNLEQFRKYVSENGGEETVCMVFDKEDCKELNVPFIVWGKDSEEQAHMLFDVLRELDKKNIKKVYARCPDKNGIGLAVYNRLLRAAGFQVITL